MDLHLVPLPQTIKAIGPGPGRLRELLVAPGAGEAVRRQLRAAGVRLREDPALPPHSARSGGAALPPAPDRPQGYALRLAADGLAIAAHDAQGLVWACATLAQILAQQPSPPGLEITDWPTYPIRYHHDDVSRKQVSTPEDFARIVRLLAGFKVSHYTVYLEDMVRIPGLPLMGEGRGAFDPAGLRALAAEGRAWGVEVFPTLSLAGHQENLLRLPRYRRLGAATWQPPSTFRPGDPAVREHLLAVLDAVCPCFDSPWFHMGFDEVLGLDADGFAEHLNWCAERLVERGKTPLFWCDMLYNHFGCDLLARLHPAAVPVPWGYDAKPGKAEGAVPGLLAHRAQAWMLGGYRNWGSFLHAPLAEVQRGWTAWRAAADPARVIGWGSSQWGDDGYENHRDLGWPLFAASAEHGWSGGRTDADSLEERFQTVFHGHPLPALTAVRRQLEAVANHPGLASWRRHRLPAPGWSRLAARGLLPSRGELAGMRRSLAAARRGLAAVRRQASREAGHLGHYAVAIDRLESCVLRAQTAHGGKPAAAVAGLRKARASFRASWLAHNRPESMDVALGVFDQQLASWTARPATGEPAGWRCLDLGWDAFSAHVAGLPIGRADVADVPWRFAPRRFTHREIAAGTTLALALPGLAIADLHLCATQPRRGDAPAPALRLRLLLKDRLVYEEELLSIRHLCDWWAPLGEHMWAGGGFAYVDPQRVSYVLSPVAPYGLTAIHRFPWPVAPVADRLELTTLAGEPVQLFAASLRLAPR